MFKYGYLEPVLWEAKNYFANYLLPALLVLAGTILAHRLVSGFAHAHTVSLNRVLTTSETSEEKARYRQRIATTQVTTYGLKFVIWVASAMICVERLGLALSSMVPIATVLVASLGFGGRRLVQDYLSGIVTTSERQYGTGDEVQVFVGPATEPFEGIVESVTLRNVRLRLTDGSIGTFGHGEVYAAINTTPSDWTRVILLVEVSAKVPVDKSSSIITEEAQAVYTHDHYKEYFLEQPDVSGVVSQNLDQTVFRVSCKVKPGYRDRTKRIMLTRIQRGLQKSNILGAYVSEGGVEE